MNTVVNCPVCDKSVAWTAEAEWRPFCSERCKLIDLGQWASEAYAIAGKPADEQGEGWSEDKH